MTLDQIAVGNDFVISSLFAQGEIRRRLVDMGFVSGARGRLLRKALLGGPLEVALGTWRVAVRLNEARGIEVVGSDACV